MQDDPERARRLAEVFGDVLPSSSGDDVDESVEPAEPTGSTAEERSEQWLRENRPPHHDSA